jgi:SAM-dependent methyltransferase
MLPLITSFNSDSKNCLICGADDLSRFNARAFDVGDASLVNIVECRNCNFAWQFPLSRNEQESVMVFEAAYRENQNGNDYFDPDFKRKIARLEMSFVNKLQTKSGSILDIGAGSGMFAEVAAENGWKVTAVDPAIDPCRYSGHSGIRAIKGALDEVPEGEKFDVVTLWDVIEHVTDPVSIVCSARERLKKNGWIVIETGNYKSVDRVSDGINSWIYQLDHRWYFNPEAMEKILIDNGFSDLVFSDKVLRPNWSGNINYAGPSLAYCLKSIVRNPLALPLHISKYISLIGAKKWRMPGIGIFAVAARMIDSDSDSRENAFDSV